MIDFKEMRKEINQILRGVEVLNVLGELEEDCSMTDVPDLEMLEKLLNSSNNVVKALYVRRGTEHYIVMYYKETGFIHRVSRMYVDLHDVNVPSNIRYKILYEMLEDKNNLYEKLFNVK